MKYVVNKSIDYLSVTVDKTPDKMIGDKHRDLERSPLKNYNKAFQTDLGAVVCNNTQDDRVRTHIIMTGSTVGNMRGEGHTDREIAEFFMAYSGCKISRVDIQVTAHREDNGEMILTPDALARIASTDHLVSKLKPDNGVSSPDATIETAYIGSRKSRNRLFRAYDKGNQLGLARNHLIRFELETRKRAKNVLNAVAKGIDIGSIIKQYVDFPNLSEYQKIMSAPSQSIPHIEINVTPEEKRSIDIANRWYWLLTSVAPALAKALCEDYLGKPFSDDIHDSENLRLLGLRVYQLVSEYMDEVMKNG